MKVLALLIVSVALLQTSFSKDAEASSYEANFPQEEFAEAYPMEADQDDRVLPEQDDDSADEIVDEQTNWSPVEGQGEKLERLLEKWTNKPATDLAQHPAYASGQYGSGAHHPDAYTSGHAKPAPFASGHAAAVHPAEQHTEGPPKLHEVLSIISFLLNMPITEKMFKTKKASLQKAMAKQLGLPVSEVTAMFENLPVDADADIDDVLVEEQVASHSIKFKVTHKSKDSKAAKARQAKIKAGAKQVAAGGKSLDGIKVPKQAPKMKVQEKAVKAPLKKSGVSSSSMPNLVALVVVGLTSMWYF